MADANKPGGAGDPHNLSRFVQAQEQDYDQRGALPRSGRGRKQSHWMWYIFPQFDGLGFSATSRRYSINLARGGRGVSEPPTSGAAADRLPPRLP